MQCKSNDNISATKYKHASSLVSHKTVKSRKIATKKQQIVQRASRQYIINATNENFFQTTIPIYLPFPVHLSHSLSHEFSLCFTFPWDSHGTHGNSRIMHTSTRECPGTGRTPLCQLIKFLLNINLRHQIRLHLLSQPQYDFQFRQFVLENHILYLDVANACQV